MTAGEKKPEIPSLPHAYVWDENNGLPPEVLHLWTQVGDGIDKNQTVVWKSAVESLDNANKYLSQFLEARLFCEKYMASIIGILVEQQPAKIGQHERNCVQDSLALAVMLVAKDLEIQIERKGQCLTLDTLSLAFNKRKLFYKGTKGNWNMNHMQGLPEARLRTIERFRNKGGFQLLSQYIIKKTGTTAFPKLDILHQVLIAACDTMVPARSSPTSPNVTTEQFNTSVKLLEDDAISISQSVIHFIRSANEDSLKKIQTDLITEILRDLQRIFDRLVITRRRCTYDFYVFWRELVLRMITSKSLPLKLYGWEQVADLIDSSMQHRPPPKAFIVRDAGCTFVNGRYEFAGSITEDGYSRPGAEISYVRKITEKEGVGKKLTLFRCTMRSQQKWWFLSEADEEQPGTDRDIDYYQHKSKEHEEAYPPPSGWLTCRATGIDPPPQLDPIGVLVPEGQEFLTLDHQLAQWAIENEIVEQVLGDTTIHREVVARSTSLVKFLAGMCDRYPSSNELPPLTKRYCLQSSHLLFAWKTCLRKADAAVSSQVYLLLVSILPLCPVDLAIPLLQAVQTSLHECSEGRDHLFEVSEFCSSLATGNLVEQKGTSTPLLKDEVREQVLDLLWSVLTHRDASSLRTYDSLKKYVSHELRVEPNGSEHRKKFLGYCIKAFNESLRAELPIDEVQALRMVKLAYFILDSCPREQSNELVASESGALPRLLFQELTAYLKRRRSGISTGFVRKPTVSTQIVPIEPDSTQHLNALSERLRILRHVYGLTDPCSETSTEVVMSFQMVEILWQLCDSPEDREALLIFIASASHSGKTPFHENASQNSPSQQSEQLLSPAFNINVSHAIFFQLVCSSSFCYERLGVSGYRSFQHLFGSQRQSLSLSSDIRNASLDALWRICLTVESDEVASQAMKDLLNVYVAQSLKTTKDNGKDYSIERMVTDEKEETFSDRIFQCLSQVKADLDARNESAGRSAERCLRILNAAIGQSSSSLTSSTLIRLSKLDLNTDLEGVLKCIPHGMRGQACYKRVGVIVKRPQVQNQPQHKEITVSGARLPSTLRFSLDLHPFETLDSIKYKVALNCQCSLTSVKPVQINGRAGGIFRSSNGDPAHVNLNVVPEDSVVDELGIVEGCEIVFVVADRALQSNTALPVKSSRSSHSNDLSALFFQDGGKLGDSLFSLLLGVLRSLPLTAETEMSDVDGCANLSDNHQLVWDFLLALPTNSSMAMRVKSAQGFSEDEPSVAGEDDAMDVDPSGESWTKLLDLQYLDRSVYVLLTIDAFLRPAHEAISILPSNQRQYFEQQMKDEASAFRRSFIEAGGFGAVVNFFSCSGTEDIAERRKTRRGNAVALRILKTCLFGYTDGIQVDTIDSSFVADEIGGRLLQSFSGTERLLKSLTSMVIDDRGISSASMADVLRFLRLLIKSSKAAQRFVSLPDGMGSKFLLTLLLHDDDMDGARTSTSLNARLHVRQSARDLILQTPLLAETALPWLMQAVGSVSVASESTGEYFDVMEKLLGDTAGTASSRVPSIRELQELGTLVCKKLASCPRPSSETEAIESFTGVLCGCLKLLRALIENNGIEALCVGTNVLLSELGVDRWSDMNASLLKTNLSNTMSTFGLNMRSEDSILIDLMGAIFDGFLAPAGPYSIAICCDKESRRRGFDVVGAAARFCQAGKGYLALVNRINNLIEGASPHLRNRWGQFSGGHGEPNTRTRGSSKYSGLRNQGCTCYMNSVLQQLFMMPELRDSMCSAPLPDSLRSSGSNSSNGSALVGKTISLQWENGVSYDAIVLSFDEATFMHCIRYSPMHVATAGAHHSFDPAEIARLPPQLPDEFVLSEGRPGKETGVFDVVAPTEEMMDSDDRVNSSGTLKGKLLESVDEAASRHLLEEVQRTFIHLAEGSRGRCFDPRALVEACACLKLEFDVWQQNDASEFATKLLDRLEISLKKWAPAHFKYMDHTFGLKQTKQKICRECGLKTNREEKLLNIDCQIRGKTDILDALAAMTEVEIMEGSNKVFCDNCKKNTDTILRTAISTLPNMLILSLKRFDLDYNTFETVKLNSRCAFDQSLNMKRYTLEGLEAAEKFRQIQKSCDPSPMDMDDERTDFLDPLGDLPDEDYEYRLAGVLVHAGVAQGGHYYSFIKDRNPGSEDKWYRFDDEDVTLFNPASIETECFGGKIKKESKWPNGQVHTVEQEQFANALMLFYEKVKPTDLPVEVSSNVEDNLPCTYSSSSGYEVFNVDVRRSNATHMWQSFLFDCELQTFLKGLLGMCRLTGDQLTTASNCANGSWRIPLLQMLLSYVFDVLMYSSDRNFLHDWTRMLEDALLLDHQSAREFVFTIARKTQEVSANWLRTYVLDCPDPLLRASSVRVFSAATRSCAALEDERLVLGTWRQAWEEQTKVVLPDKPVPWKLEGHWAIFEDINKLNGQGASSLGVILSFLNCLLDAMPRCWRFSSDLCVFVRHLASSTLDNGESVFRLPMIAALIPVRLIGLAVRDRLCPPNFRLMFPGTSISVETANTQLRPEANVATHVMSVGQNHMMQGSDVNAPRGMVAGDFAILLEALCCVASIPGSAHVSLVHDIGEIARGRRKYSLTEVVTQALSQIFQECCLTGGPNMSQREVESYLHRCGVDTSQVSSQKIFDMLAKYHNTTGGSGSTGSIHLSLDGFLAYYRDAVQSNDLRLRQDLNTFGFRPDLSRRSHSSRINRIGDRTALRDSAESIALDVAEHFGEETCTFGSVADTCMSQSLTLYTLAFNISEPLANYLVAGAGHKKHCSDLINRTLQAVYTTPAEWGGNDTLSGAIMILKVLSSLPGSDQDKRISLIMESTVKAARTAEHGVGLLNVIRYLHHARQTQHYPDEAHWSFSRYIDVLKALRKVYPVFQWMAENATLWSFIDQDILESHVVLPQQSLQIRSDYGPRDGGVTIPLDHHTQSDSDIAGINDSEDDEDSHFEISDGLDPSTSNAYNEGPFQILVEGAGLLNVNGVYRQDGQFQGACRYIMAGRYSNQVTNFYVFQCNVSNNTKHWYISIVPSGSNPGTSSDIDFYTAPATAECRNIPPRKGWIKAAVGKDPAPIIEYREKNDEDVVDADGIWKGFEEENDEGPYV